MYKIKLSKVPQVVLLFIVLIFFTACSNDKPDRIVVGTNKWIGYSPLYLARHNGYFKGSNIKIIEYPSATQVLRSFENGVLNVAALTLDETILLANKGYKLGIILITDISNGGDALMVNENISSKEDLIGKKIGVEDTALGSYALVKFMQQLNIDPKNITVVPVEISEHVNYFKNNLVDAVVTFEPVVSELEKFNAKVLIDSSEIKNSIIDILVYNSEEISNKQQIKDLKDIWYKSLNDMHESRKKSISYISKQVDSSVDSVEKQLNEVIIPQRTQSDLLLYDEIFLNNIINDMNTIMIQNKTIDNPVDRLNIKPFKYEISN